MMRKRFSCKGVTAIELLIAVSILSVLFTIVFLIFRSSFSAAEKGTENLNLLQAQSVFLAYLKHDLRTLIFDQAAGITPPELVSDEKGTSSFSFYKVENVDEKGRPLPIKVQYSRASGDKPAFSIQRQAGSANKIFVKDMVATFSLEFLNKQNEVVSGSSITSLQKARIRLSGFGSDFFEVVVGVYSPYIQKDDAGPLDSWYANYLIKQFSPGSAIRNYQGVILEEEDYELIPGAHGIALLDAW